MSAAPAVVGSRTHFDTNGVRNATEVFNMRLRLMINRQGRQTLLNALEMLALLQIQSSETCIMQLGVLGTIP